MSQWSNTRYMPRPGGMSTAPAGRSNEPMV